MALVGRGRIGNCESIDDGIGHHLAISLFLLLPVLAGRKAKQAKTNADTKAMH